jgi:hypothetical protein
MSLHPCGKKMLLATLLAMASAAPPALAVVDSGSTGADGVFDPPVNRELELPPSGIFNFTSVNVRSGVTVTFKRNATNTPVVMLVSGNVTIAGSIVLSGGSSKNAGAAGDGNLGDDAIPGKGGPGGYDGGVGGQVGVNTIAAGQGPRRGGNGLGPGGGTGGEARAGDFYPLGGGAGGFSGNGGDGGGGVLGGVTYGSALLLPLIGGSGGGGGAGGTSLRGSGGGGGGGALLIAASGTINVSGSIFSNGGDSGATAGQGGGNPGGAGSGGAIRLVATTISGNGTIQATGGGQGGSNSSPQPTSGGNGGAGRIRLEAENLTRTAATNPAQPAGAITPGPIFVAGMPTLRISSVAGVSAPAAPTGTADIVLPASTTGPIIVGFETTGVPVGNTVVLRVKPQNGLPSAATSPALNGSSTLATASVSVTLPSGPSTLEATTSYTVVASLGDQLGNQFALGERVERIELAASVGGASTATLITVSNKRYPVPAMALASGKAG